MNERKEDTKSRKVTPHNYVPVVWHLCKSIEDDPQFRRSSIDEKIDVLIGFYKSWVANCYLPTEYRYLRMINLTFGPVKDIGKCYFKQFLPRKKRHFCVFCW
jgi:hypothetical protein